MTHRALTAAACGLVLALSACSGGQATTAKSDAPSAEATPSAEPSSETRTIEPGSDPHGEDAPGGTYEVWKPGTYEVPGPDGGTWTVHLPADPAEAPDDVVQYLADLQGPDESKGDLRTSVEWIKVDIDNRGSQENAGPIQVTLIGEDGEPREYAALSMVLRDMQPVWNYGESPEYTLPDGEPITEAQYNELSERGHALEEKYDSVHLPGAQATTWFIGTDRVPETMAYGELGNLVQSAPIFPVPEGEAPAE